LKSHWPNGELQNTGTELSPSNSSTETFGTMQYEL